MAANKIKGQNLSLTIGGKQVELAASSVVLNNEDADTGDTVFAEYTGGTPVQWFFEITARSDYASGGFWDLAWNNNGSDVPFVFKPYGNTTASPTQPHFTGSCHVVAPPAVGGAVGETFTFDTRWDCTTTPTKVTS